MLESIRSPDCLMLKPVLSIVLPFQFSLIDLAVIPSIELKCAFSFAGATFAFGEKQANVTQNFHHGEVVAWVEIKETVVEMGKKQAIMRDVKFIG